MRQKRDTNSKDEKKERKRERQIERDPSRRKRHREETKRKNGGKGDIIANIYNQTYCYWDRQKTNSEIKIYEEGDREKERQK